MGRHRLDAPPGIASPVAFKAAGLTRRVGDHLAREGIVTPSIIAADGKGTARLWSLQDVTALRVVAELRRAGVPLQRVRRAINELRRRWPDLEVSAHVLVTNGADVLRVVPDAGAEAALSLVRRPGQLAWRCIVLDVSRIAGEVRAAVARAERAA